MMLREVLLCVNPSTCPGLVQSQTKLNADCVDPKTAPFTSQQTAELKFS